MNAETFRIGPHQFIARTELDPDGTPPWDQWDMGTVTPWSRRGKAPGEMVVCTDRHGNKRFYGFAGRVAEYRRLGATGMDAAKYARGDYERCRLWADDQRQMLMIAVACPGGETQYLGGVESDSGAAYFRECAEEIARAWIAGNSGTLELPGIENPAVWE